MCYKIKLDSIGILIPQNGTKRNVQNINLHIKKRQPLPTAENEQLMHLSKNNQLKSNGGCYFAANFILFRNIAFYIKFSLNIIFLNFVTFEGIVLLYAQNKIDAKVEKLLIRICAKKCFLQTQL